MTATVTIKFGGESFEIEALPIRPAREWRKRFESTFDDAFSMIGGMNDLKLETAADLGGVLLRAKSLLLGAVDRVVDLVFLYSPKLNDRRVQFEEVATDEEAVEALIAIIGLAYPFGALVEKFRGFMSGPESRATSKN